MNFGFFGLIFILLAIFVVVLVVVLGVVFFILSRSARDEPASHDVFTNAPLDNESEQQGAN